MRYSVNVYKWAFDGLQVQAHALAAVSIKDAGSLQPQPQAYARAAVLTVAKAPADHTQSEARYLHATMSVLSSMTMLLAGLLSYSAPDPYSMQLLASDPYKTWSERMLKACACTSSDVSQALRHLLHVRAMSSMRNSSTSSGCKGIKRPGNASSLGNPAASKAAAVSCS